MDSIPDQLIRTFSIGTLAFFFFFKFLSHSDVPRIENYCLKHLVCTSCILGIYFYFQNKLKTFYMHSVLVVFLPQLSFKGSKHMLWFIPAWGMGITVRRVGAWFSLPVSWLYNKASDSGLELFVFKTEKPFPQNNRKLDTQTSPVWILAVAAEELQEGPRGALKSPVWRNSWTQESSPPDQNPLLRRVTGCRD